MKDISRWIRLYDEKVDRHDVKRCLAEANLVKGDLLEILAQWPETEQTSVLRSKIAVQCLDLLKDLTWPITLEEDKATVNHHRHLPFLQLAHVAYKRAILHHENAPILRAIIRIIIPIISTPKDDRSPREWGILNVALYFFRNIAIINQPQNLPSQGDENEVSRSATIESFHQQDVLQLILTIASSIGDDFAHQDVVILELLFHLLKGINPSDLFKERKEFDSDRAKALRQLMDKEKAMMASYQKHTPSRHHRFGAMIWVKRPDQKLSTLSGQKVILDENKTLDALDKSKSWNKPKPRSKKADVVDENSDFAANVRLEESTRITLRSFVEDFLDSSFNPLFNNLRRAIASEADRAKDYNVRQYYYLTGWFLQAERARQELLKKAKSKQTPATNNSSDDSPFAYIAAVMTQENFVLLNRKMQQSLDDKEWSDLHACIRAFTEVLHTIAAMSESSSEDDQEIAENIQSRIFYEETTHDLVIAILRNYKDQGFAYLDSCTELAHVFMRMLERYSKQNVDLQIRSKRRARRKRKAAAQARGEEDAGDNSERDDEVQAQRTTSERKFDFNRYAVKFMTEPCIDTFVKFTQFYADLDSEQLKRAHRFFYRCAFKMERAILLFRVDILHLFHRMIKGPEGLRKESTFFKDWEELVKQVFRRCIKKLDERRELMVEMLFTKMPSTIFYLENGYDYVQERKKPRAPAELVVKPGMTKEEEIGVAISVLVNQGKLDDIAWIKKVLSEAADERKAWLDQQEALASVGQQRANVENPEGISTEDNAAADQEQEISRQTSSETDKPQAPAVVVKADTDERKLALFKDKFLRLLLSLLRFERLGDSEDPNATWMIPSSLTGNDLTNALDLIKKLEFDLPTFEEGVTPESLLRNKSASGLHMRADRASASRNQSRANSTMPDSDDEGVGLSDIDELDERYAPGGPTATKPSERPKTIRKRRLHRATEEVDEDERKRKAEERRRNEKAKDAKIKSTTRITDSDDEDDEARDAEFFRLEEHRRGRMKGIIRNQLLKEMKEKEEEEGMKESNKGQKRKSDVGAAASKKPGKTKKRRTLAEAEDGSGPSDVDMNSDSEIEPVLISGRETSSEPSISTQDSTPGANLSDEEMEEEGEEASNPTPLSSEPAGEQGINPATPLATTLGNKGVDPDAGGDEDKEDDVVITRPVRRNIMRGPFIVESDSE